MNLIIDYITKTTKIHEEYKINTPEDIFGIVEKICEIHPQASMLDFQYNDGENEIQIEFESIRSRLEAELVSHYYHGRND